jgi:glycosyltransferase involved in cell wall biosynthesis
VKKAHTSLSQDEKMIDSSHSKILLFTKNFPYGHGEAFLESEISILSHEFDEVHIFPLEKVERERETKENCFVHNVEFGATKGQKKIILQNLGMMIKIVFSDLFSSENRKALNRPKAYFHNLIRLFFEADHLTTYLQIENLLNKSNPCYTYWFSHWTNVLSVVKTKVPDTTLVTRTHGYDFNMERNLDGFYWFRPFTLKAINKIFNVSAFGRNYLQHRYPSHKQKVRVSYLGVQDQINTSTSDRQTIVSCSNVIPLKRVELIPEVLKSIDSPINWVHFGDGQNMDNVKKACEGLPENVSYDLKGQATNKEVLDSYKDQPVGLFLHLSESEGLPVSMMEAQSFGIPIVACDTGGINEIVNEETGALLPVDFDNAQVKKAIEKWIKTDESQRKAIQNKQKEKFSSSSNYKSFCNELKQIIK